MNSSSTNGYRMNSASSKSSESYEDTLRLITHVPVPDGLLQRVQTRVRAGLHAAPRSGRILAWPPDLNLQSGWMRAAAAAAIVSVVAGGGWGIYSSIQLPAPVRVISVPPRIAPGGGFSSAGAMRTPQTLNGPVLTHPQLTAVPASQVPGRSAVPHFKVKPVHKDTAVSAPDATK